jgi:hypothetical protein
MYDFSKQYMPSGGLSFHALVGNKSDLIESGIKGRAVPYDEAFDFSQDN